MSTEATGRDPQTYAIIGAAMEVHGALGHGFLEDVYLEAMTLECQARGIPYDTDVKLYVEYKGKRLKAYYRADLICYGAVVVELKTVACLASPHLAQVINYLKATRLERGLLINFGASSLEHRRVVFTHARHDTQENT